MTDEHSRAISFANNYFALVDGLAYGLEEHLAEDVSLNWFGKTVNGKRNVAAFMRINMTNSRHMFDDITPASGILKKKRTPRRKHKTNEISADSVNVADELIKNGLDLEKLRIEDSHDAQENKIEVIEPSSVIHREISAIFTENIPDNSVKQENVNDQSPAPTNSKMEYAANILLPDPENSMKFIKANGIVHIHRSAGPNKIRKRQSSVFVSGLPGQTCRRHCKLQVAYTRRDDQTTECKDKAARLRSACANKEKLIEPGDSGVKKEGHEANVTMGKGRKRSNSHEAEMQDASFLETDPTFNPFEDFYSFVDKRRFLEYFDAQMAPKFNFTEAKYIGDRLVFDWTGKKDPPRDNRRIASFKFNYLIHTLIYESNATSSLTEEFEDRRSLSDTEKSV